MVVPNRKMNFKVLCIKNDDYNKLRYLLLGLRFNYLLDDDDDEMIDLLNHLIITYFSNRCEVVENED